MVRTFTSSINLFPRTSPIPANIFTFFSPMGSDVKSFIFWDVDMTIVWLNLPTIQNFWLILIWIITAWLCTTVKPRFTAPWFNVNPDLPHLKRSPNTQKILYHPRQWTRDPLQIWLSDRIPSIMQACNDHQITYTPYLGANYGHKHWLSAVLARWEVMWSQWLKPWFTAYPDLPHLFLFPQVVQ